jgi:hypothetical protein
MPRAARRGNFDLPRLCHQDGKHDRGRASDGGMHRYAKRAVWVGSIVQPMAMNGLDCSGRQEQRNTDGPKDQSLCVLQAGCTTRSEHEDKPSKTDAWRRTWNARRQDKTIPHKDERTDSSPRPQSRPVSSTAPG